VQKTEAEMLKTKNFRPQEPHEIKEILAQMGLSLGMKDRRARQRRPGPTSISPACRSGCQLQPLDDEDEPLDSVDLQLPTETENF